MQVKVFVTANYQ